MDGVIDFSIGLSGEIAWPWPIAVYLFLAGIAGGALGVVLTMTKLRGDRGEDTPLLKAASLTSLVTICLGMVCLVLDLTDPFVFWRILIYYNPTSVMSIGVMMLLLFIPLTAVLTLIVLRRDLARIPALGGFLEKLGSAFSCIRTPVTWLLLFLAFGICAYTGFLISALIRYPLINTAVLPALFVASGLSAGTACAKLVAAAFFGAEHEDPELLILHKAEWPMMAAEAAFIFMIAMAMIFGFAGAQASFAAFTTGVWAAVFWIGAIGIGFGVPFVLGLLAGEKNRAAFWISGTAAVVGMMCLRLFILYAGQLNSLTLVPV